MNCNTTHYRANSSSVPGDPTLALSVAIASCAPKPAASPEPVASAPAPPPAPAPSPVASYASWMDVPATPGDWRLSTGSGFTAAQFGDSASEPRFALRCDRASRQIALQRAGSSSAALPMMIRTETRSANLSARPQDGALPLLSAGIAASHPLLDAMAITKGRFAVEVAGLPTLYLPAWAEVSRVIEDCR